MGWIHDIGSLSDFVGHTLLSAPDSLAEEVYLRREEQLSLERAFEELRHGIDLVRPTQMNGDKRKEALTVLEESLSFYRAGEKTKGAQKLRDFEALIASKL